MLMLALAVTAVPVLARILADRQMLGSRDGRIALAAAVAIDALTWLLLAIVLGLAAAGPGGAVRAAAVLLTGGVACVLLRRLLAGSGPARWCARFPRVAALALGVAALAAGALTERFRLTMVFGAVMVGLAVPRGEPDAADQRAADNRVDGNRAGWDRAVRWVGTAGRWIVPVFFTVTGMTVLAARAGGAVAWAALGVALALAVVGKTAGSYLGARA